MTLRWRAAGMLEADHQFRRFNVSKHLPELRAALELDAGCASDSQLTKIV